MRKRILPILFFGVLACFLLAFLFYNLPPVHSRLAWRLENLWYKINPPKQEVFVPSEQGTIATLAQATTLAQVTALAFTPTPTITQSPLPTPTPLAPEDTPQPTSTSTITPTPTPTPTLLPTSISLQGVKYEDQHNRFNYCAPANLAMALSYWGWQGNRDTVGPVIKPDAKDKNVMPYEMVDYVLGYTNLKAIVRVGGDLERLKHFIASGFPVLVEKGVYFRDLQGEVSWMGHFQVLTGYDDAQGIFVAQDSYVKADTPVPYNEMIAEWRSFNYTYLIIYPPEKEADVMALLGPDADETYNYRSALQKASEEISIMAGIDLFFAWYNYGTNLVNLQDYAGAANAYDQAYTIYPTIPEKERPWRAVWYQTGPYFAYYYTARYQDVIHLADITLGSMKSEKNLEESYLWRGRARLQIGDTSGAIEDFKDALKWHPGWAPAIAELQALGIEP